MSEFRPCRDFLEFVEGSLAPRGPAVDSPAWHIHLPGHFGEQFRDALRADHEATVARLRPLAERAFSTCPKLKTFEIRAANDASAAARFDDDEFPGIERQAMPQWSPPLPVVDRRQRPPLRASVKIHETVDILAKHRGTIQERLAAAMQNMVFLPQDVEGATLQAYEKLMSKVTTVNPRTTDILPAHIERTDGSFRATCLTLDDDEATAVIEELLSLRELVDEEVRFLSIQDEDD